MANIEQLSQSIKFTAFLRTASSGFGKTGLVTATAITVDVYNPAGTHIITAVTPSEVGDGWYSYTLSSSLTTIAGEYLAVFKTTDVTCFPQHVEDRWLVGRPWVEKLDQSISSRSTLAASGVWGYANRNLTDYGLSLADPSVTPTVSATGGGTTGGLLQAGDYYLKYTFTNAAGETKASASSSQFTIASGNIPLVTLPSLPVGATGINIYLTTPYGPIGTETLYKSGVVTTTTTLATAHASSVINNVNITNGGSGYTSAPTITFVGGSGSGATATAGISGNQLVLITVTAQGSGYTIPPAVSIVGGGGSGALATAQTITTQPTAPNVNTTSTLVTDIWTATSRTLSSFGFNVTVGSNSDKTGYKLAADGLDAISVADPGVIANHTTLSKMIVALWRYYYKKTAATANQLKTYANDNTTVNVTMALTNDGTTQTKAAGA